MDTNFVMLMNRKKVLRGSPQMVWKSRNTLRFLLTEKAAKKGQRISQTVLNCETSFPSSSSISTPKFVSVETGRAGDKMKVKESHVYEPEVKQQDEPEFTFNKKVEEQPFLPSLTSSPPAKISRLKKFTEDSQKLPQIRREKAKHSLSIIKRVLKQLDQITQENHLKETLQMYGRYGLKRARSEPRISYRNRMFKRSPLMHVK